MKLTVLSDNNTRVDKYLFGEAGLSFYIETDDKKILFDCGYSDIFIQNAFKLKIDLRNITDIVFSHAHNDHTAGLFYLRKLYQDSLEMNLSLNTPTITAHSDIFTPIIKPLIGNVSFPADEKGLVNLFNLNITDKPFWFTDKLCFTGRIQTSLSEIVESSLVYISQDGLVIITGCAHVGISNIIERAKKITNISKIKTIIGGFHLLNPTDQVLTELKNCLNENNVKNIYPCHCTDLKSKITLSKYFCVKEVCVGDVFEF